MSECHQAKSLLQLIDRKQFDELCQKWEMDKGVRRLTTWEQTSTLVLAYLLELTTLREVEAAFCVPRATLSDANHKRSWGFFHELCELVLRDLVEKSCSRKIKRAARKLLLMDASSIRVNARLSGVEGWGQERKKKRAAAKLTVLWDIDGEWVEDFRIGAGFRHDNPTAHQFEIVKNATYVFDRGYQDLLFWWKIVSHRAHFVTRLKDWKRNREERIPLVKGRENEFGVLWDGEWKPNPWEKYKSREIPEGISFRRVIYRDKETGKLFDFVTSDRRSSGQTIADIYKKRWAVELVFRWFKGHLKVRYLDTRNRNAIKIQLAVAMLVRLLVQLAKVRQRSEQTAWQLLRRIRAELTRSGLMGIGFANAYTSTLAPCASPPG